MPVHHQCKSDRVIALKLSAQISKVMQKCHNSNANVADLVLTVVCLESHTQFFTWLLVRFQMDWSPTEVIFAVIDL